MNVEDKKYHIQINGQTYGPLSYAQVSDYPISSETLVWCTGQPKWLKLREVPEFAPILAKIPPTNPYPANQMPKTWLVESILVTMLCCLPFGVIGIINASQVESAYRDGDYAKANRYSSLAKKWTIWGVVAAAVITGLYILFLIVAIILGSIN